MPLLNNLSTVARRPCVLILKAVWKFEEDFSEDIVDLLKYFGWPVLFTNDSYLNDCLCFGVVERDLMRKCINNKICKFLLLCFKLHDMLVTK